MNNNVDLITPPNNDKSKTEEVRRLRFENLILQSKVETLEAENKSLKEVCCELFKFELEFFLFVPSLRQTLSSLFNEPIRSSTPGLISSAPSQLRVHIRVEAAELGVEAANIRVEAAELGVEAANIRVEAAELGVEAAHIRVEAAELGVETAKLGVETAHTLISELLAE